MAEKKYFIRIDNQRIRVSENVYRTYYGLRRQAKTLEEKDRRNFRILYSNLDTSEILGEEMVPDICTVSVEDIVIAKLTSEKLHRCISLLPDSDQELIRAMYFNQLSERKISKITGIPYMTLHDRKTRILKKLRELMINEEH